MSIKELFMVQKSLVSYFCLRDVFLSEIIPDVPEQRVVDDDLSVRGALPDYPHLEVHPPLTRHPQYSLGEDLHLVVTHPGLSLSQPHVGNLDATIWRSFDINYFSTLILRSSKCWMKAFSISRTPIIISSSKSK